MGLADASHGALVRPTFKRFFDRDALGFRDVLGQCVQPFGPGEPWHHVVHGYARRGDLIGECLGEPRHGRADRVRQDEAVDRLLHGYRSDVDDPAPPGLLHRRQYGARKIQDAVEVLLDGGAPCFDGVALEGPRRRSAGIRDQNIDLPEVLLGRFHETVDVFGDAEIRRDGDHFDTRSIVDPLTGLFQGAHRPGTDHEVCTLLGQFVCDGPAETATRSCHQRCFSFETKFHTIKLPLPRR